MDVFVRRATIAAAPSSLRGWGAPLHRRRRVIYQHRYDVVIVGAGGARDARRGRGRSQVRTAVLVSAVSHPQPPARPRAACAPRCTWPSVGTTARSGTFDTVRAATISPTKDAVEIMCKKPSTRCSTWKMRYRSRLHPEGPHQRRFGRHARPRQGPVRRACCDRTGHMILQTLYQNCQARRRVLQRVFTRWIWLDSNASGPVMHRGDRLRAGDR